MDKHDALLKYLLQNKKEDAKLGSDCITDEMFAAYLDNLLDNQEKIKIEGHLVPCQDCRKKSIALYKIRKELAVEPITIAPAETTKMAKQLVKDRSAQKLIEVVISVAKDSMKIIKDSAKIFRPMDLMPVEARTTAGTTVKTEKGDLRNIIYLCKELNKTRVDIFIERIDDTLCDIELKTIDAESGTPIDNVRINLISGDRELASLLTKNGITAFRNLELGSYTLTFIEKGKLLGDILLRLEAE